MAIDVKDTQHRPVPQAEVTLRAQLSNWREHAQTDGDGKLSFSTVPAAEYVLTVTKQGFQTVEQRLIVRSGAVTALALVLPLGAVAETVQVTGTEGIVNLKSVTTETLVTRDEVEHTPGALRSNSLAAVTQFVPGAYLVHDQLHIRGGHQVSWLVDGVPVPNTNIAGNVGPQFDPKDIDTMEIQRGGYSAEVGDRTYGVFNVVPRSGFERNREAELLLNYGNFHETNDQVSLGDHSERAAYYASLSVNRTDLGLETPVADTLHDEGTGIGGFGSWMYKTTSTDQLRVVASVRADHYQIPNGPDEQEAGIDDRQRERDGFVNVSWLRTLGSSAFLRVSPFYHYNLAAFDGGPGDPIITTDHRASHYVGGQAVLAASLGPHNARVGAYGFYQYDHALFGLQSSGSGTALNQVQMPTGNLDVAFAEDQFAATDRLTLSVGVRVTHFAGGLSETAVDPRVGAVIRLPRCDCGVRAYYGRYYQAPPLTTVSGPLADLAVDQGFGFLPLKGERDEQYEIGVAIPAHGWAIDLDYVHTRARNFFDHDVLGNSNIFLPVTIDTARIRAWEATVRSPRGRRAQTHLAYSHQFVQGRGAVSGGLTSFEPPEDEFFFLDHDQRDTLAVGLDLRLIDATWISGSIDYGSGFLEGDGPNHKPAHAIVSLQASRAFGKQWTVIVTGLNLANTHFLFDDSNTFGGTHYNSPRQISAGVKYRFHY
ncbi:MAG TPA: TonB-dependent receptor [Vicinamibacterales bacterium]|nr:TonB-dependent receptor [Vicinamibacterales bacterium]